MKNTKRLFLTTVFLAALLSLTAFVFQVPAVQAAEMTVPEKALLILDEVAGFNMTAYTPFLRSDEAHQFLSKAREEVDFRLTSSQGSLRATCSFIDKRLHRILVSDYSGSVSLDYASVDVVSMSKDFLQSYQSYTGGSLYGNLNSLLDEVDSDENVTRIVGDVKLAISNLNQSIVDITWTYVDGHGVPAVSKNVVLNYRDGMLKMFLDNWDLYTIAAEPLLSSEQAVAVALDAVKNYSWTVENTANDTVTVSNFNIAAVGNTSLCYLNYREASSVRGDDAFILYPSWHIPLGFDKVYPGGLSGVAVRVWADTGDVSGIGYMVVGPPSPGESKSAVRSQEQAIMLTAPIITVLAIAAGYLRNGKTKLIRLKDITKRFLKVGVILLCLITSFSLLSTAIPQAQAISNGSAASAIYASLVGQIEDEQDGAEDVCDMLEYLFDNAGYNATENEFGQTTGSTVLDNTYYMERNYDHVAVFYFGHMDGPNNYWCSDFNITYSDIAYETLGRTFFAWSWVCRSATSSSSGLPLAWTNSNEMNNDGYADPDSGGHCYIGFDWASPTLNNSTGSFKNHAGALGMEFITWFYYYALEQEYSINDSLDLASSEEFSTSYGSSPLDEGFETWWPVDFDEEHPKGWYEGYMHVYGNGNLFLAIDPPLPATIDVAAWIPGLGEWTNVEVYVDDSFKGYTNYNYLSVPVSEGYHDVWVSEYDYIYSQAEFQYFYVNDEYVGTENPTTVYADSETTPWVVAYYG